MTDFKFAKECSEKGIEFDYCKDYYFGLKGSSKFKPISWEKKMQLSFPGSYIFYPNPSEEELSKRLPSTICRYDINYYFFIYYDTELSYYYIIYRNDIRGDLIMETGKTTKECYQKAIILLNDMELLK